MLTVLKEFLLWIASQSSDDLPDKDFGQINDLVKVSG
jgi:hypothetical protein